MFEYVYDFIISDINKLELMPMFRSRQILYIKCFILSGLLRIEPRTSQIQGNISTTKIHPKFNIRQEYSTYFTIVSSNIEC